MDRRPDPFLGETVGGKRKTSSAKDAGLETGVEAGLNVLAEAAPVPVAVIGGLIVGVGLLGFIAWKAFQTPGDRIRSR